MKKYIITLTKEERDALRDITRKGTHQAQKILNAHILLLCDESEHQTKRSTNEEISQILGISMRKIDHVKKRFVMEGLEAVLSKKKGNGTYEKKIDGEVEAHLIALSCSEPPEGFARWSLRLLADKAVELGYIDSISHEAVRTVLKKTEIKPWKEEGWIRRLNIKLNDISMKAQAQIAKVQQEAGLECNTTILELNHISLNLKIAQGVVPSLQVPESQPAAAGNQL